ncbi:MAG: beta-ketoacyl synthase N-terminal-like domain-containing protein, partial [Pseudohongiellaceae bacterium]
YVLKEPTRWLDLIEHWRASITWAPNFVFSLLLDRQEQLLSRRWDLSCMRFMVNAGEAVVSATARRFLTLLQPFGLPETALRPAFGMVETCSGITWSTGFKLQETSDTDLFVSLGPVIPGAAMKIVDEAGMTVDEGVEGRLLLKGPSVFNGYEGEAELNASMLIDGWLVTGDLAFIKAGELHVTGREKDMVIINGNNHYCHEIEAIVGKVPAVAGDCVAAVGFCFANENTESLVIFYSLTSGERDVDKDSLEKALRSEVASLTGISTRVFVALQPDEFPRTEIGKIKRGLLKRRFESGEFGQSAAVNGKEAPRGIDAADADDSASYRELLINITAIWKRALKLETVGLDETFFELGGSSLLAIQVQHELELLLEREVSMVELFDTPTIRSMAMHFSGRAAAVDRIGSAQPARSGDRNASSGDIAVIGIACRFPGAHGPEAFWRVLEEGVETLTFFTPAEAIAAGVAPERAHDPAQVNVAPVLDDVEGCDLDFWKYAQREAELLDPQQRVFLETAWEAFEDAGYVPGAALGKVGVYASAATNTYLQNNVYANSAWVEENGGDVLTVNSVPGFNVMVANDKDYLPTRVSYKLDLTGPSMGIQTACSSTLVAVHEAARALRAGECDMALAGGCALMLPQHAGHYYEEGMINSPDGHCRAYDRDAKGTIFGSGSGAVLLKRLDQALADGDAVYAVIKGSAVVNDGGQKMGFTAPSMLGEYRAISQAIENAGVDADSIGFVEGHGTGTPIGDPIEVQALTKAFRHDTQRRGYCALGSVKTNIGHMGIASGIAGFIKAVLALHHKTLPATLHFNEPNPAIGFAESPFYVSNRTRVWEARETPRRAGVNSLGIGGTNVHVILEEAPNPTIGSERDVYVLPVSAGSEAALNDKVRALADFVARHPDVALADIAFTHQRGRLAMACRRAFVAADRHELLTQLSTPEDTPTLSGSTAAGHRIVFMFTGQGSQYAGMGKELYDNHPVFRESLDACTNLFAASREHSIRDLILADADDPSAEALLSQTQYTQPALFCIQVALVQLYRQLGIRPDCIVGHSIGEIAGVWAAGGLSLADAAVLVEARSRLMQAVTENGAMASVKADVETVRKLLHDAGTDCEIAACNSPFDTTITGATEAVERACASLQEHDIRVTPLNVSHAFHSRHMEKVQHDFAKAIANLEFRKTLIPVICNLDAAPLDHDGRGAEYWRAQLRAPVLFMQGLRQAITEGGSCFVEIGPAAILCGLGRALEGAGSIHNAMPTHGTSSQHWIPSLRKGQRDARVFANALATLFTRGHAIDWSGSVAFAGKRAHLPTYPWQRQRCWIDPDVRQASPLAVDPLLAPPLVLPQLGQQLYVLDYSVDAMPVLAQHRVFGSIVPPAALYVSQLLHTAADFAGQRRVVLSDVNFIAPMHLGEAPPEDTRRTVQIRYGIGDAVTRIELSSQPVGLRLSGVSHAIDNETVKVHVTADLLPDVASANVTVDMEALHQRCNESLAPGLVEAHMAAMQVALGESFLCFHSIQRGRNEALARLDVPRTNAARIAQGIPAGLIDCHWQTMLAALPDLPLATIVPARIDELVCHTDRLPAQVWAHALIHQQSSTLIIATVSLLSATGQVLLESRHIEFRVVAASSFRNVSAARDSSSRPGLFSRHWKNVPTVTAAGGLQNVWLAGQADAVKRFAAQLRRVGVEPLMVEGADAVAASASDGTPLLPLIYVDDVTSGT